MTDDKLCPFCGNYLPEIPTASDDDGNSKCVICGAIASHKVWNTRPIEDALLTRAEAAEAERDSTEKSVELHANINRGVATALGLDLGASWHNLPERVSKLVAELAALREQTRLVNDRVGEAIEQLEYELGEWLGVEPPYNDYPYANEAHALLSSVYQRPTPPESE